MFTNTRLPLNGKPDSDLLTLRNGFLMTTVLYSPVGCPIDYNCSQAYDLNNYPDTLILLHSDGVNRVFRLKDIPTIFEIRCMGGLFDKSGHLQPITPLYSSKNRLSIGFAMEFDIYLRGMMEGNPSKWCRQFIREKSLYTNKHKWINLSNGKGYYFHTSMRVRNGISLNHWDVFHVWEIKAKGEFGYQDNDYLLLIKKNGNRSVYIPIPRLHFLFSAKETKGGILVYLAHSLKEAPLTCLHIRQDGHTYLTRGDRPHHPHNQKSLILQEESILDFVKKVVYGDLCICTLNKSPHFNFIFPNKCFNESFLSKLMMCINSYCRNYEQIPTFIDID